MSCRNLVWWPQSSSQFQNRFWHSVAVKIRPSALRITDSTCYVWSHSQGQYRLGAQIQRTSPRRDVFGGTLDTSERELA
jgi:hypothetical protein